MVKVERSFPAPASLALESQKANGSYSMPDVVKQLKEDFHNKCYICELNELQDAQVEHLLPHLDGKYPKRKFDWNCGGIHDRLDAGRVYQTYFKLDEKTDV